jgi:Protein of unknown function (DUF2889)
MYLFNRSISINVRSQDEKAVTIDGVFMDSHHEICLTLEVDLESDIIKSAVGEIRRAPHTDCEQIHVRIKELIGVNLKQDVRKQIQAAIGLNEGCTHLTDLALECVKGLLQAKFVLMHRSMKPEDFYVKLEHFLDGSCLHYKKS